MSRKQIILALVVCIAVLTTACGNTDEPIEQINVYDKTVYECSIDIDKYANVIEDILFAYNNYTDVIKNCINEHSELITQNMVYKLEESAILEVDTTDKVIGDTDNPDEEYTGDYSEFDDTLVITNEDGTESVLYPIYDITGNIYDYGTLEESESSLDYIVSTPVYVVTAIDGYNDRLVATVATRFGSNIKIVFDMDGEQLNDYTIYR